MKSKANAPVTASILLTLALLMCGCVTRYVCVGTPLLERSGRVATIRVPITVEKSRELCKNGLEITGEMEPTEVPLLWNEQEGEGEDGWAPSHGNTYIPRNFGQFVQFKIDVTALNRAVRSRLGEGEGPYPVFTRPFLKGLELGRKHHSEQLKTYRLLIELTKSYPTSSPTCGADRDEFLRGFGEAYDEADTDAARAKGKLVVDLLRKSLPLENSIYKQLLEQGRMHEKGWVSNAEITQTIRGYIGSLEQELACKAGYIEGYVQAHSSPDKEDLYVDALWMYIAVRPRM